MHIHFEHSGAPARPGTRRTPAVPAPPCCPFGPPRPCSQLGAASPGLAEPWSWNPPPAVLLRRITSHPHLPLPAVCKPPGRAWTPGQFVQHTFTKSQRHRVKLTKSQGNKGLCAELRLGHPQSDVKACLHTASRARHSCRRANGLGHGAPRPLSPHSANTCWDLQGGKCGGCSGAERPRPPRPLVKGKRKAKKAATPGITWVGMGRTRLTAHPALIYET